MTSFKFNWHESKGTFYDWMLVHLISHEDFKNDFEEISELTNNFNNVELGITVNGKQMNAKAFIDRLEQILDDEAGRVAKETLTELKHLNDIQDQVDRLQNLLSAEVNRVADDLGIELSSWD